MFLLSWFDNRTLFSCQFILAIIFSILFFSMRRTYPSFRGIGSVALSLLLAVPGVLLLYMQGIVPDLVSTTLAALLILSSFALFYRGVIQFLGDDQFFSLVLKVNAVALAVICFCGAVLHNRVFAIAALSIAVAFARGLVALSSSSMPRAAPSFASSASRWPSSRSTSSGGFSLSRGTEYLRTTCNAVRLSPSRSR